MKSLVIVACGGAIGAVARYLVYQLCAHWLGTSFPYATLFVNIAGSFIMGIVIEAMVLAATSSAETRLFLAVGILGAFTTFSTFSLDFAVLYRRGALTLSMVYVMTSVIFSIAALFAGLALARKWFGE
jgi:CrcB protein